MVGYVWVLKTVGFRERVANPHEWSLHNPFRHVGHQAHSSKLGSLSVNHGTTTLVDQIRERGTHLKRDHLRPWYVSPM